MKIIIVEDEPPAVRSLTRLIKKTIEYSEITAHFETIEEVVEFFTEQIEKVDLIFLDIHLADGLSFEIFKQVKINLPIIFTTAYDEYALKAFQTNGIAYLLKPIQEDKFKQAIEKYKLLSNNTKEQNFDFQKIAKEMFQKQSYKERFLVKKGERFISVAVQNIAVFLSEDRATVLYTKTGEKYIVEHSLEELDKMLKPEKFFRLNRQVIAEFDSIAEIHQYFNGKLKILLNIAKKQEEVIVSRDRSQALKKWLNK